METNYYVYIYFRPSGIPCYVGYSGKKNRWLSHLKAAKKKNPKHRNLHLMNIIRGAGGDIPVTKIRENLTLDEALKTEIAFIAAIGRKHNGGPLVNLTDGGEGPLGLVFSEESKKRIGDSNRGKKRDPSVGAAISAAKMGKPRLDLRGKSLSEEHRKKIGAAQKGIPRKIPGPETRLKMSQAHKGNNHLLGHVHSEETRKKMSLASKGKKKSPEACRNMALGAQARRHREREERNASSSFRRD